SADYVTAWETATLTDLFDVDIATGVTSGQFLGFTGSGWTNVPAPAVTASLATLSDVSLGSPVANDVLTYNGSVWSNSPPHLSALTGVTITAAAKGQSLVYDGSNWINASAFDPPIFDLGSVSSSTVVNLQSNAAIRLQMSGNLTISSFTFPTASSGQFIHRV